MKMVKKTILCLGGALLPLLAQQALAASHTAYATRDVNLRAGPGPYYRVINVIPEDGKVWINHCRGSWCNVDYHRWQGWMSSYYLAAEAAPEHSNTHIYFEFGDPIPDDVDDFWWTRPHYHHHHYHHHRVWNNEATDLPLADPTPKLTPAAPPDLPEPSNSEDGPKFSD